MTSLRSMLSFAAASLLFGFGDRTAVGAARDVPPRPREDVVYAAAADARPPSSRESVAAAQRRDGGDGRRVLESPPPNDGCDSGAVVPSLPYRSSGTTLGATADFDRAFCGAYAEANGVWFRYAPGEDKIVVARVDAGLGIRVYSGGCGDLSCLGRLGDGILGDGVLGANSPTSTYTIAVRADVEYKFLVSKRGFHPGSAFGIDVWEATEPPTLAPTLAPTISPTVSNIPTPPGPTLHPNSSMPTRAGNCMGLSRDECHARAECEWFRNSTTGENRCVYGAPTTPIPSTAMPVLTAPVPTPVPASDMPVTLIAAIGTAAPSTAMPTTEMPIAPVMPGATPEPSTMSTEARTFSKYQNLNTRPPKPLPTPRPIVTAATPGPTEATEPVTPNPTEPVAPKPTVQWGDPFARDVTPEVTPNPTTYSIHYPQAHDPHDDDDCEEPSYSKGSKSAKSHKSAKAFRPKAKKPKHSKTAAHVSHSMSIMISVPEHGNYGECVHRIMEGVAQGSPVPDARACCASNTGAPYCRYLDCGDGSCDCSVLADAYAAARPYGTGIVGLPEGSANALDACCAPGLDTLDDATECLLKPDGASRDDGGMYLDLAHGMSVTHHPWMTTTTTSGTGKSSKMTQPSTSESAKTGKCRKSVKVEGKAGKSDGGVEAKSSKGVQGKGSKGADYGGEGLNAAKGLNALDRLELPNGAKGRSKARGSSSSLTWMAAGLALFFDYVL